MEQDDLLDCNMLDFDKILEGYEPPEPFSPKLEPHPLTYEQRIDILSRSRCKRMKSYRRTIRIRRRLKIKKLREMEDYSEQSRTFNDPAKPEDRINPYNYGNRPMSRHNEPQDVTPAAEEFKGVVDLFDPRLFPAQNSKKYSDKSGREFLADFTKATRGQLVVSMARIAQDNPKEFAKLWVEMEKFNTPQQAAVDINADVKMKAGLYAKLDAMSGPVDGDTVDLPPEEAHEVDANGEDMPEANYELPAEEAEYENNPYDNDDTDNADDDADDDNYCPCSDINYCRHNCPMYDGEHETCTDELPSRSLFPNANPNNDTSIEESDDNSGDFQNVPSEE